MTFDPPIGSCFMVNVHDYLYFAEGELKLPPSTGLGQWNGKAGLPEKKENKNYSKKAGNKTK